MRHFDMYRIISASLRVGVLTSLISLIAGITMMMIQGGATIGTEKYTMSQISSYTQSVTLYSKLIPLNNLFNGMYHLDGAYFITFGLWVLIFTPITVVIIALVAFVEEKNRLYVFLSSCVLFVLFFAMLAVPHFLG